MTPLDETAWDAWSPDDLSRRLLGVTAPWYIVGGWALDLWLGTTRRDHDDLEFATLPDHAPALAAHLSDLAFFEAASGTLRPFAFDQPIPADAWQFWGADFRARRWRVDMMLERGTPTAWRYKRAPEICQSRDKAIRTNADGVRYLAPANVLLFKAKHRREKDEDDFEAVLPTLPPEDRATLRAWLSACHPGHAWLSRLHA